MNNKTKKLPVSKPQKVDSKVPVNKYYFNNLITFSFKSFQYKCIQNSKFTNKYGCAEACSEFLACFLEKMHHYSTMNINEIKNPNNAKSIKCHPVQGESLELLIEILSEAGNGKLIEQLEDDFL